MRDAAGAERELELAPERSFGVLRLRHALGDGAYVGAMATAVNRLGDGEILQAEANHDAYSQGLDGFWYSEDGGLRLNGQLVMSQWAGGPGHHDADGRACTPSPADPTCLPITRLDGTVMGPGAFGYGGTTELQLRRGHLLLDAELAALSPRLDLNDAGFLDRANGWTSRSCRATWRPGRAAGSRTSPCWAWATAAAAGTGCTRDPSWACTARRCFATTCTASWSCRPACPAGTSSRPPTAAGSSAAGATAPVWMLRTDSRRAVQLGGRGWGFLSMNGGPALGGGLHVNVQPGARLQLEIGPEYLFDYDTRRFYDCVDPAGAACHAGTELRHYRFAEQDSSFVSLTTRGTYTFTSRLTFQWYGQLFLARGRYDHFREIDTVGTRPYIRRADLRPSTLHRRRGRRRRQ